MTNKKVYNYLARKKRVTKVSINKLARELKNVSQNKREKFLQQYSQQELEILRDRAVKSGNIDLVKYTVSSVNKKAGFTGAKLRVQNKANLEYYQEEITTAKERAKEIRSLKYTSNKLKKVMVAHDIDNSNKNYIYGIIPNYQVIDQGKEEYIKKALWRNDKINPKFKNDPEKVREIASKNFDQLVKRAKELKVSKFKEFAVKGQIEFMETRYFKNGDKDLQRTINEYVKRLPLEKVLQLQNVLLSDEFKEMWDSNVNNTGSASKENQNERASIRQHKLIDILQNETELSLKVDPKGKVTEKVTERIKAKNLFFNYYLK